MRQHRKRQEKTVSSRAPVWGGISSEEPGQGWRCCVSSRAPVWGHPITRFTRSEVIQFQVVPPCGGINMAKHISDTRASFKSCPRVGASFRRCLSCWPRTRFKSCPRVGASQRRGGPSSSRTFQVVPRVGGIICRPWWICDRLCFKSCPRVGASVARLSVILSTVFQVVPPCGGIFLERSGDFLDAGFQVVPPCGGHRGFIPWFSALILCFKSCPRVGASFVTLDRPAVLTVFKSCPRVGGIADFVVTSSPSGKFQVVPRVGGISSGFRQEGQW